MELKGKQYCRISLLHGDVPLSTSFGSVLKPSILVETLIVVVSFPSKTSRHEPDDLELISHSEELWRYFAHEGI